MAKNKSLSFDALMSIDRVSDPVVSPNGEYLVYVTTKHDKFENCNNSTIRYLDLKTGKSKILTPGTGSHSSPSISPDGKRMVFVSDRSEGSHLWLLDLDKPGEAKQLTKGDGGASKPVWSPDGKYIAFSKKVVVSPNCSPGPFEEVQHHEVYNLVNEKSKARVEDHLLFRHWDKWRELKRSHVFLLDVESGEVVDIIKGDLDSPPISLGGTFDYSFSPDGNEIAYVANPDRVVAQSTNNSIFIQKLTGIKQKGKSKCISKTKGVDNNPRYSPDGKYLAFLSAPTPLYESDRQRIMVFERASGKMYNLTEDFDRAPIEIRWSHDSKSILFLAPDRGHKTLYNLTIKTRKITQLTEGTTNNDFTLIPGTEELVAVRDSSIEPNDLFKLKPKGITPLLKNGPTPHSIKEDAGAVSKQLTNHRNVLKNITLNPPEEFWYKGADNDPVHGFLIKPPGFDKKKKYPLMFIIHGGPQSAFFDNFSYRWNLQMFASWGYVVSAINPRGSTGFGQEFCDQISGDWGGRCYEDLMKGLDYLLDTYNFIDKKRVAAAGASFGGFMINWIQGHTDRFKALVCHDGIFQAETMAYSTEELWFDMWEHGMPHEAREDVLKFSPHLFVDNFSTPQLIIHGEQDFRCPVSEAFSMFTALHTKKVPARLLYFPDEGHWVLKPVNSEVWYDTIKKFLEEYL